MKSRSDIIFDVTWCFAVGLACCIVVTFTSIVVLYLSCPVTEWSWKQACELSVVVGLLMGSVQAIFASSYSLFGVD